jgi:hypothetical protein
MNRTRVRPTRSETIPIGSELISEVGPVRLVSTPTSATEAPRLAA